MDLSSYVQSGLDDQDQGQSAPQFRDTTTGWRDFGSLAEEGQMAMKEQSHVWPHESEGWLEPEKPYVSY